jgi:hypothetical protein
MKNPTLALLIVAATLLAACEPSQSEVEKAMKDSIGSANSAITGLLGDSVRIEIRDVRKLGCEKASAASYKCDVEWTATLPVLGESKKLGTLTFMKASDGWVVSK